MPASPDLVPCGFLFMMFEEENMFVIDDSIKNNICVYQIENLDNGCVYVGYSSKPRTRLGLHKRALENGVHNCRQMQEDYDAGCSFEACATYYATHKEIGLYLEHVVINQLNESGVATYNQRKSDLVTPIEALYFCRDLAEAVLDSEPLYNSIGLQQNIDKVLSMIPEGSILWDTYKLSKISQVFVDYSIGSIGYHPKFTQIVKGDEFLSTLKKSHNIQHFTRMLIKSKMWLDNYNDLNKQVIQGQGKVKCKELLVALGDHRIDLALMVNNFYLEGKIDYQTAFELKEYIVSSFKDVGREIEDYYLFTSSEFLDGCNFINP